MVISLYKSAVLWIYFTILSRVRFYLLLLYHCFLLCECVCFVRWPPYNISYLWSFYFHTFEQNVSIIPSVLHSENMPLVFHFDQLSLCFYDNVLHRGNRSSNYNYMRWMWHSKEINSWNVRAQCQIFFSNNVFNFNSTLGINKNETVYPIGVENAPNYNEI